MMGLVHDALENHKGKAIKFIVPIVMVVQMTKQDVLLLALKM
jgi:hypothetical protein